MPEQVVDLEEVETGRDLQVLHKLTEPHIKQ